MSNSGFIRVLELKSTLHSKGSPQSALSNNRNNHMPAFYVAAWVRLKLSYTHELDWYCLFLPRQICAVTSFVKFSFALTPINAKKTEKCGSCKKKLKKPIPAIFFIFWRQLKPTLINDYFIYFIRQDKFSFEYNVSITESFYKSKDINSRRHSHICVILKDELIRSKYWDQTMTRAYDICYSIWSVFFAFYNG